MLKLTMAVLAIALAGTASAGWRSLRVDGSSEASFKESVAAIQEKLPEVRRHLFAAALQDIWVERSKAAAAEQREYTESEYFRQLDGLGYQEVVRFTDPTGDTAQMRYKAVYANLYQRPTASANTFKASPYSGVPYREKVYPSSEGPPSIQGQP